MTDDQFFRFCPENDSIRFERDSAGDIILMEPTGSETERFNVNIITELTFGTGLRKWAMYSETTVASRFQTPR